jgi:hypothetical protein
MVEIPISARQMNTIGGHDPVAAQRSKVLATCRRLVELPQWIIHTLSGHDSLGFTLSDAKGQLPACGNHQGYALVSVGRSKEDATSGIRFLVHGLLGPSFT